MLCRSRVPALCVVGVLRKPVFLRPFFLTSVPEVQISISKRCGNECPADLGRDFDHVCLHSFCCFCECDRFRVLKIFIWQLQWACVAAAAVVVVLGCVLLAGREQDSSVELFAKRALNKQEKDFVKRVRTVSLALDSPGILLSATSVFLLACVSNALHAFFLCLKNDWRAFDLKQPSGCQYPE